MNDHTRVVLRNFADRFEAETIRIRLAAEDIEAFIMGTDLATALSMGGASTFQMIRVEVAAKDFRRATELLADDERRAQWAGEWNCDRCGEPNEATFDVCWSCQKPRGPESGSADAASPGKDPLRPEEPCRDPRHTGPDDRNPYRPVLLGGGRAVERAPESADEAVSRAFRAATVGMLLLPPLLNIYSIYLLLQIGPRSLRDRRIRGRAIAAWTINVLMLPASALLWANLSW